jgi:hypothetical protein
MIRIIILFLFAVLMPAAAILPAHARTSAEGSLLLSGRGFILLHPYFDDKSWKAASGNIEIISLPDTFSGTPGLAPLSFDIGKNMESTVAVFTTAQGDLFQMPVAYTQYFGDCTFNGGLEFSAAQKIPLSGIALSGKTPIYLVKDPPAYGDTLRIIAGISPQFLCCFVVKASTSAILRTDTLRMQGAGGIVRIAGDYSSSRHRDTLIWAVGAKGTIRSFAAGAAAWGSEKSWDIADSLDTVTCIHGTYAGTSAGKIYKKTGSQTFTLENAGSGKAIHAIYPQAAIGSKGNFIEHVGNSWRSSTLGSQNNVYAHFVRNPGGFGAEILDDTWKLSSYTYRDSASKISLTIPGDRYSYVNNGVCFYPLSGSDTGLTVYVLDPDSSYRDVELSLKSAGTKTILNNDGLHVLVAVPDSQPCQFDAVRLSSGIVNIALRNSSITIRENAEIGTPKTDCGTCYWKKYDFIVQKSWNIGDTLTVKAGKDALKIVNNHQNSTSITPTCHRVSNPGELSCGISGNRLILRLPFRNLKTFSIFDISGRRLYSAAESPQQFMTLPVSYSRGLMFIELVFTDGSSRQMALPVVY